MMRGFDDHYCRRRGNLEPTLLRILSLKHFAAGILVDLSSQISAFRDAVLHHRVEINVPNPMRLARGRQGAKERRAIECRILPCVCEKASWY